MKFIKDYKLFESYSESGFNKIFFQRGFDAELKDKIEELNNHNNNFDPYIIKDLFIDLFDDGLVEDIEIIKIYKKEESKKQRVLLNLLFIYSTPLMLVSN